MRYTKKNSDFWKKSSWESLILNDRVRDIPFHLFLCNQVFFQIYYTLHFFIQECSKFERNVSIIAANWKSFTKVLFQNRNANNQNTANGKYQSQHIKFIENYRPSSPQKNSISAVFPSNDLISPININKSQGLSRFVFYLLVFFVPFPTPFSCFPFCGARQTSYIRATYATTKPIASAWLDQSVRERTSRSAAESINPFDDITQSRVLHRPPDKAIPKLHNMVERRALIKGPPTTHLWSL